jgi:hypothetical protein
VVAVSRRLIQFKLNGTVQLCVAWDNDERPHGLCAMQDNHQGEIAETAEAGSDRRDFLKSWRFGGGRRRWSPALSTS